MAILGFELEEIVRLIALLESSGMSELTWEEGDRSIRIRGPRPERIYLPAPSAFERLAEAPRKQPALAVRAIAAAEPPSVPAADQIVLASPMVGTFYRAEKPGGSPMIEIGQMISVGQSIGVIEAMKVFSEIPAEHAGLVLAVPAQDGQLVQKEQPLVILKRLD